MYICVHMLSMYTQKSIHQLNTNYVFYTQSHTHTCI